MGRSQKRKGDKIMKKIRRIFAVLLSLAMVLGMSMTTFAAGSSESPFNSNITITNLAVDDNTTVNVFKAVYLNEDDAGVKSPC